MKRHPTYETVEQIEAVYLMSSDISGCVRTWTEPALGSYPVQHHAV